MQARSVSKDWYHDGGGLGFKASVVPWFRVLGLGFSLVFLTESP